jgi:hypothetical protein
MSHYSTSVTVVEGFIDGNKPIESTYKGVTNISITDGHLILTSMPPHVVIAAYAPKSWLSLYRTEEK